MYIRNHENYDYSPEVLTREDWDYFVDLRQATSEFEIVRHNNKKSHENMDLNII